MTYSLRPFARFISAFSLSFATMHCALADDTDLYLALKAETQEVNPNLLLIVDSSGSMDTWDVPVDLLNCNNPGGGSFRDFYRPNYNYPGTHDRSRFYFFSQDNAPSSGNLNPLGSFKRNQNRCLSIDAPLDSIGYKLSERLATYRDQRWNYILPGHHDRAHVECQSDEAIKNGFPDGSSYYARKGQGGAVWTKDINAKIDSDVYSDGLQLYTGNRLNYEALLSGQYRSNVCTIGTYNRSRIDVVKSVANDLIASVSGLNIGVMTFNGYRGGYVRKELVDVDGFDGNTSNKTILNNVINNINASGSTPLGETLYEAVRYLKGETPDYGRNNLSVASSLDSDGSYKSPISNVCQVKNNIILLSDGIPTADYGQNNDIQRYLNRNDNIGEYLGSIYDCPPESYGNSCLIEVARFAANNDLYNDPDTASSADEAEQKQTAVLSTIGFKSDIQILEDAAAAGKGKYYQSNNVTELTQALQEITQTALEKSTTFVAPAVSVSAFNRLQHNNDIYYAPFKPSIDARWNGNLKRYKLSPDGDILGRNNANAIDENTGAFKTDAYSFWPTGTEPDGNNPEKGGALNKLPQTRTIYTYLSDSIPRSGVNLNATDHRVNLTNTLLTNDLFNASNDAEKQNYINWALGKTRKFIGDPLHSNPVVVVYGKSSTTDGNGNTVEKQDSSIFFGTNEGFLHAVNTDTGAEQFAFIPKQLLDNLKDYSNNTSTLKRYGLDGEITIIKNDLNDNGVIYDGNTLEETDGVKESVYLYIGMRRGGSDYFAFDITDRSNPKLMWQIKGGAGDFAELAQSWSRPVVGHVKTTASNGTNEKTQVLFFGGGYDTDQDNAFGRQVDDSGRSIFMVNAKTGELMWSAGPNNSDNERLAGMQYSIPAPLNAIDADGDGYTDTVFAANMGGEVWRFDLADTYDNSALANFGTGGRILDIVTDNSHANNRRFFAQPDVAVYAPRGKAPYFIIALGSGARPDPLDETTVNRFYMLKEYSPFTAPVGSDGTTVTYTTKTESDLFDTTDNLIQDGSEAEMATAQSNLEGKQGWFITLAQITDDNKVNAGEKVLASSTIVGGVLLFTTFSPELVDVQGQCKQVERGISRLYALNILDGSAAIDQNNDGVIEQVDREANIKLSTTSALSEVQIIYQKDDNDITKPIVCSGPNCSDEILENIQLIQEEYWREDR